MHWWHGVHFLMGTDRVIRKSLWWYGSILEKLKKWQKQGYKGARWPKMTSYSGDESPSPIGPLLIWQQPILSIMLNCSQYQTITGDTGKYMDIVFETAAFMSSYAEYDAKNRYVLGPALILLRKPQAANCSKSDI